MSSLLDVASKPQPFASLCVTNKSPKPKHDLLEPINHDDEKTIHRLVSIQHQRSFAVGTDHNITPNQEQRLYNAKKIEILNSIEKYSDEDDSNDSNDSNGSNNHNGIQSSVIRDITFSMTPYPLMINKCINAKPQLLNDRKSLAIADDTQSTDTLPLHNASRHKIKREKTPIPSDCLNQDKQPKKQKWKRHKKRNRALKIECDDEKYNNSKQLSFKTISGDLEKKSASKFVGYQKRWFYLWKDKLDYYKDSSVFVRGSIRLWNIEHVGKTTEYDMEIKKGTPSIQKNKYHKPNKFTFELVIRNRKNIPNAGRTYRIRAKTQNIRDEWISAINNNISILKMNRSHPRISSMYRDRNSSQYKRMNRSRSNECIVRKRITNEKHKTGRVRNRNQSVPHNRGHINTLYKEDMITFKDICTYSNTGDILLFDTKSKTSACVRAATGGNYDHIGMIFRIKGGKVGVLEALGSGVQVFLWDNFLKYKWNEQYSRIAFRSLIIPDINTRKEIKRKLARFVKTVVNRHYGFNPMALIRKQSAVSLYDESRTFFCSELIAKALKEVGLLRNGFASSQYFPSHFQESKGLALLKGCSFSKEMEVIWNWIEFNGYKEMDTNGTRTRTTGTSAEIQIVSLHNSKEKKQRFKSPPPKHNCSN